MIPAWKSQHACAEIQHTDASEWHANAGHQRHSRTPSRPRQASSHGPPRQPSGWGLASRGLCFVFLFPNLICLFISLCRFPVNRRGDFCLTPSFLSLKSCDKKQMFVLGFQQLYPVQSPTVYIWLFFYFQIIQIPRTSIKFLIIILPISSLPNYHCVSEMADVDRNGRSGRPTCVSCVP